MKRFILAITIIFVITILTGCREDRPPNTVNSIEDAANKIIGAMSGTPSARLAEELGTARTFDSANELIGSLLSGRIDCAVMESIAAGELVSESTGVRILSETLMEYDLRFAIPRENAELLRVVNSALSALNSNGMLKNLRDKYFSGKNYTYVPPTGVPVRPGFLTLAVPPDSPPYSYKDSGGEYTGLDVEVARAVCDYLGVELRIVEEDVKELVTAVWFGRADLAVGWLPDDVDGQVSISDDYANTSQVILVRR